MKRSQRGQRHLPVTAPNSWNDRVEMADAVRTRLGNDCGVLVFTPTEFEERACGREPAVNDIRRDGVALVGLSRKRTGSDLMATAEQRNHARASLKQSEEYLPPPRTTSAPSVAHRQRAMRSAPASAPRMPSSPP
jgi:hypothetical protein